ncbi:hypothetical protein BV22DRAFT_1038444 [Leucogyrophana mollusca]|uniref:Uncharacterized protein n=1 Tax=Leucogyrophana mollusca TaxID=85980 RepID=A0ACB8B750_9AGAM|nr:hypothetical protein BV22DRAFT_1038444 [Leucogyrophana mollusca]
MHQDLSFSSPAQTSARSKSTRSPRTRTSNLASYATSSVINFGAWWHAWTSAIQPSGVWLAPIAKSSAYLGFALSNLPISPAYPNEITLCLKQANTALTHTTPWVPSQPPTTAQAVYLTALEMLLVCGMCLQPFGPTTADQLLDALDVPAGRRTMNFVGLGTVESAGLGRDKGETHLQRLKLFEVPKKVGA